jgi:uncharacterized protein YkwD
MSVSVVLLVGALGLLVQSGEEGLDPGVLEQRMVRLVNVERMARGLRPLESHAALGKVARNHSRAMVDLGEFSHEADGSQLEERIKQVIQNACRFGENITKHYTIEYALSDLMGSPGHRGNLLDPDFTGIGIGIVRGEEGLLYITQDFFSPCKKGRTIRLRPKKTKQ